MDVPEELWNVCSFSGPAVVHVCRHTRNLFSLWFRRYGLFRH